MKKGFKWFNLVLALLMVFVFAAPAAFGATADLTDRKGQPAIAQVNTPAPLVPGLVANNTEMTKMTNEVTTDNGVLKMPVWTEKSDKGAKEANYKIANASWPWPAYAEFQKPMKTISVAGNTQSNCGK